MFEACRAIGDPSEANWRFVDLLGPRLGGLVPGVDSLESDPRTDQQSEACEVGVSSSSDLAEGEGVEGVYGVFRGSLDLLNRLSSEDLLGFVGVSGVCSAETSAGLIGDASSFAPDLKPPLGFFDSRSGEMMLFGVSSSSAALPDS